MNEVVMAIIIDKRSTAAPTVQQILTAYGDIINFRLGFHDLHQGPADENGQILLQLKGDTARIDKLTQELSALELVKVKSMSLD